MVPRSSTGEVRSEKGSAVKSTQTMVYKSGLQVREHLSLSLSLSLSLYLSLSQSQSQSHSHSHSPVT